MSNRRSKAVCQELTFLAALDSIHTNVDTSEIAEIRDWSRAVRGKFHGASAKEPSRFSRLKAGLLSALGRRSVADEPSPSSKGIGADVLGASGNLASDRSVQYSQMAIPQLIAKCISESSETAWHEFIRRVRPIILMAIVKVVGRYRNASYELVDDLSQEVYLRLFQNDFRALRALRTGDEFVGVVRVIASTLAQDYFRRAASSKMGVEQAPESGRVFPKHVFKRDPSSEPERKVLLKEIDAILKKHAHEPNFERDYAIFWLYYRHGLTAKEIAASPGVELSVKGVDSTLLRLTRQMRVALKLKDERPS